MNEPYVAHQRRPAEVTTDWKAAMMSKSRRIGPLLLSLALLAAYSMPSGTVRAAAPDAAPNARNRSAGVEVTILAVFTDDFVSLTGGDKLARDAIASAASDLQLALDNSKTGVIANLLAIDQVSYLVASSERVDLGRLSAPADGYLDEVQLRRDELGADLVVLFTGPIRSYCGYANSPYRINGDPTRAYAVVSGECGSLTMAHEVGHLFGAGHYPDDSSGLFTYSNGFNNTEFGFRDVMSFAGPGCVPCTWLDYYSSPDILYNGHQIGSSTHDNARTIREYAPVVSAYRGSPGSPMLTAFVPLSPARLLDTRPGYSTVDNAFNGIGLRQAGTVTELTVAGRAGIPTDASAAVLNIAVTDPQAPGFITVYPCGAPRPNAANLNHTAAQTIPNLVIAKIGVDGKVCIYTLATTALVADLNGYFPANG